MREAGYSQESEPEQLKRLNADLDTLGFNLSSDDPDYLDFLRDRYHQVQEDNI
ncbi:hypothetical protein [Shewanella surugensis]|uniref:Uncharacterized protein n=1 Tax=Shewanella surugensis TaxID=212020 RepID=A0ABT0LF74_9GAMM|nr:hypothetical protein [Shewanella surugensis]MCL1126328.1 hypothetical protein [Shewanella surugensis]